MAHLSHLHLWEATAIHNTCILHCLAEHAEGVMQTPLCLIQHMRACNHTPTLDRCTTLPVHPSTSTKQELQTALPSPAQKDDL